ncbi:hypothetical protein EJ110_NYTH28952 [Nymphaea thermarum]|nr:hypothetical protein EJ110_NYTH28952 [Nymphaea thermarum]
MASAVEKDLEEQLVEAANKPWKPPAELDELRCLPQRDGLLCGRWLRRQLFPPPLPWPFSLRVPPATRGNLAKLEVRRRDTRRMWRFRLYEPGRERSGTAEALRRSAAVDGPTRLPCLRTHARQQKQRQRGRLGLFELIKLLPWPLRAQLHEMGKSRKQFNPDEPIVEEIPIGQHETGPSTLTGQVPLLAMERINTIEKELAQMRSDWNKAEHFRKRDLDRQNHDRQKEMEELRIMFKQIIMNQAQAPEQRATQGPDKGKEGEDESPLIHPRRPHRETTRPEERRKPSVQYEFPKFDGKEFREWLFMAERYFLRHHVPQEEWIEIATANMTGLARTHYLWFAHKTVNPTWEKYRASLQMRFGDSAFIDYDQDLKNLVQTTTVAPYQWEFEELVSMVNWPEKALIGAFKGGLRKDIKRMMKVHHFETLEECFSMARVYEENIDEEKEERIEKKERKAHRTNKQKKKPSYSSASHNKERAMVPYQGGKTIRPNQRQGRERSTRYLTPQQMEEYKKKGLCYWCDGKWDKNHRCIEKLYNIVVVDDSECSSSSESVASSSSSSSEEEVQVKKKGKKKEKDEEKAPTEVEQPEEVASLHSIQDPYQPNALRVFGRVNGQRVMILLDNGATKNFLTEEATERCKITPTGISPQIIIVGGGLRTKCQHEVKGIDVTVKKQTFKVDCLVIPLEGVDLILGMPWFLTWKDIHWDVKNFAMTFFPEEASCCREGSAGSARPGQLAAVGNGRREAHDQGAGVGPAGSARSGRGLLSGTEEGATACRLRRWLSGAAQRSERCREAIGPVDGRLAVGAVALTGSLSGSDSAQTSAVKVARPRASEGRRRG